METIEYINKLESQLNITGEMVKEKNERIAELEAEVAAAKKIIQGFADEPLPLINAVFWQQTAKTFLQAPHAAPAPAAVTLTKFSVGQRVLTDDGKVGTITKLDATGATVYRVEYYEAGMTSYNFYDDKELEPYNSK